MKINLSESYGKPETDEPETYKEYVERLRVEEEEERLRQEELEEEEQAEIEMERQNEERRNIIDSEDWHEAECDCGDGATKLFIFGANPDDREVACNRCAKRYTDGWTLFAEVLP